MLLASIGEVRQNVLDEKGYWRGFEVNP